MKRFLVFQYSNFYPSGGWHDFYGGYDSDDEKAAIAEELDGLPWHVVDSQTHKIIYENTCE